MFESKRLGRLLLAPFSLWAAIFVVLPLFFVLYHGLTDEAGAFTLANLGEVFSWEYMAALGLSVELALVSTVLCLILAYPLCMILTSMKKGKMVLIFVLFLLPLWMNSLLTTMAWQTILEKNGLINLALSALGLPTLSLINTPGAIVIGMIYNFLPYMVLPLYVSLSKIDKSVIEAAALTTFVISALLGGNKVLLVGNIIEQEFTAAYDWQLGSALSMVLMVFILLNIALEAFSDQKDRKTARGRGAA